MTSEESPIRDLAVRRLLARLRELRGTVSKDPEALAHFEQLCEAMLEHDPSATMLDLMIQVITPKVLFETLLERSTECPDCLRACFNGTGKTCEHHSR